MIGRLLRPEECKRHVRKLTLLVGIQQQLEPCTQRLEFAEQATQDRLIFVVILLHAEENYRGGGAPLT